jgi:dihydrofolate synthase / folylpolyglutamate synthase
LVLAEQRAEARDVILARARELDCKVIETASAFRIDRELTEDGCARARVTEKESGWVTEIAPRLPGRFQLKNALNAVAVARLLGERGFRLSSEDITEGIRDTEWPGRLEKLQSRPDVYLDGAHNPAAARELATFLDENWAGRKIFLVYGALRDKAVDEIAGALFPRASQVIFTEARTSRAISAAQLAELAAHHAASSVVIADPEQALDYALSQASANDAIFITGSFYLVGALRSYLRRRTQVASR